MIAMIQPSVWWDDKGGCDTHGNTMLHEAHSPPAAHTGSLWRTDPGNSTEPTKCSSASHTPWLHCGPGVRATERQAEKSLVTYRMVHIYNRCGHLNLSRDLLSHPIRAWRKSWGGRSCWPMRTWLYSRSANMLRERSAKMDAH